MLRTNIPTGTAVAFVVMLVAGILIFASAASASGPSPHCQPNSTSATATLDGPFAHAARRRRAK